MCVIQQIEKNGEQQQVIQTLFYGFLLFIIKLFYTFVILLLYNIRIQQ